MTIRRLPINKTHAPRISRESSKTGIVQKGVGAVAGAAVACVRTPTAFVSGSIVGIYKGWQIGRKPDHKVEAKNTAHCMMFAGTASAMLRTGAIGFLAAGPLGGAIALGQQAVLSGADTLMAIKGGSAEEQGREVFDTLDKGVEAGSGGLRGAAKGFSISGISGGKAAMKTGFGEGNGLVAGIFGGLSEIPDEISLAKSLKGNRLAKMARAVSGVVGAMLAAPGGLAFGIMAGAKPADEEPGETISPLKRKLIATVVTAGAGAAAGFGLGPVGMVIGGAAGAVSGLLGPAKTIDFQDEIGNSVQRARTDDQESSNPVGDKYRDILQGLVVGGAAGMRQGWDKQAG